MMRTEDPDFLQRIYREIWLKAGATEEHADIMAEAISAGDRNGKLGQGMAVFEIPVSKWSRGQLDIKAEPKVVQEGKCYSVVDGNKGSGQWACTLAMDEAIRKAKENTIGISWVRNLNDAGFLAYYVRKALDHGMVGIGTINTVPLTAPYGGMESKVGAPPFTVVCPAGEERPIIFDAAVCEAYDYDMVMAAEDGRKMPNKLLVDPETGELSNDPEPYVEKPYHRLSPILSPTAFSSPKLYGFNVFSEILTGLLTPGGHHVNQIPYPSIKIEDPTNLPTSVGGGFFMAINIEDLMPKEEFQAKTDGFIRSVKGCKPMPGFDAVYLPGERGQDTEARIAREGASFRESAWAKLQEAADKVGVDIEALRDPA